MTVSEISIIYKLSVNTINSRIKSLYINSITNQFRNNRFSESDVKRIVNFVPEFVRNVYSNKTKIIIIEYYLLFPSQEKKITAEELGVPYNYFIGVLSEWTKNDFCVTIQSKL